VIDSLPHPAHGGNLVWAAKLAHCSPGALLDFSASINPLGPPASAISAIQAHLADLTAYPDPSYQELCHALSQHHQVPAACILPGNGAAELLTWACRDLAALDATVVLAPTFSDYLRGLKAFGAQVRLARLDGGAVGPNAGCDGSAAPAWDMALTECLATAGLGAASGLLLNNPHNPSGRLFAKSDVVDCLKQFALVVVDEAFMDFLPGEAESVVDLVRDYPNLVVVRSLTKFYSLPGLRLGYAIAHPERLQRWQQWRDPWSVNALAAAVGAVVIQDHDFQRQTWDWLHAAKPELWAGIAAIPGLQPACGVANFLLVRCEPSVTWVQLELLKRHRILIRDCLSFAELGDRYFRVAVRTAAENQRLLAGLQDVLASAL
jgi:L-threonine-O-3-phosphate decarboxylase